MAEKPTFIVGNEGCSCYNRRRSKQPDRKHDDAWEEGHHGLTVGSPADRGPYHGPTVAATVWASLQFSFPFSSWIFLTYGTCHAMPVLGHFRPLWLATGLKNVF